MAVASAWHTISHSLCTSSGPSQWPLDVSVARCFNYSISCCLPPLCDLGQATCKESLLESRTVNWKTGVQFQLAAHFGLNISIRSFKIKNMCVSAIFSLGKGFCLMSKNILMMWENDTQLLNLPI